MLAPIPARFGISSGITNFGGSPFMYIFIVNED